MARATTTTTARARVEDNPLASFAREGGDLARSHGGVGRGATRSILHSKIPTGGRGGNTQVFSRAPHHSTVGL
eukprot:6212722-Pleurochrysis_carterae.AAC.3